MKRSKWVSALTVATMLMMTATASASSISLSSSDGSLYLRKGPGKSYDAVGVVHDGDSVSVVKSGDVWSQVKTSSGKVGYVKNLYIDNGDDNYASGTTYFDGSYTVYTTASVNLRSGASTGTAVITTLSKGTKLSALGKNDNFYLVRTKSGAQGYVSAKYLSRNPGSSTGSTTGKAGTVNVSGGTTIFLRKGPGRSYDSCGTVSDGQKITVIKRGEIWSKVETASGKTGYIKNLYIEDGNANYASGTKYFDKSYSVTTTGRVNLRSGASTDTKIIRTLDKSTKVTALGKNGDFYLVKTQDGTQGYVSGKYVKK